MRLSIKKFDLSKISDQFEHINFNYYESDDDGFMTCVSANFERPEDVDTYWREVQSLVSLNLNLRGKYAKWNVYFAIFSTGKLSINTKYKIQNDKFSMRKVVFDGLKSMPNQVEIEKFINDAILGSDLEVIDIKLDHFKAPDLELAHVIDKLPLDKTLNSKEMRLSAISKIIKMHTP